MIKTTASRAATLLACAVFSLPTFAHAKSATPPKDDLTCLATAMYFEARGEPEAGQLAVGQVILNRVGHNGYPDTVCGVVYQNANRRNACQFSFACDGIADKISNPAAFAEIKARAGQLLSCPPTCGGRAGDVWTSTHYHATSVSPDWSKKLRQTGRLGRHVFYYSNAA